jgi:hypothetical protein
MTRRRTAAIVVTAVFAWMVGVRAEPGAQSPDTTSKTAGARAVCERYHYSIGARVRPLLFFWLSRSGVGDAVATRREAPGETTYSLLIGSDPDRAPRRINRWGYIEEDIHGAEARLIGLMTESDEETVEQAEAAVNAQAAGRHPFKVIQATISGERARSRVTSIATPEDYTFRQVQTVLGLAQQSSGGRSRVLALPPGTKPGFLVALADVMHTASPGPITYVYDGRLYELRETHAHPVADVQLNDVSYGRGIAADFVITSAYDGARTPFSMTYGTEGRFAEVPLRVRYQPRWWMQVELTLEHVEDDVPRPVGTAR